VSLGLVTVSFSRISRALFDVAALVGDRLLILDEGQPILPRHEILAACYSDVGAERGLRLDRIVWKK